MAHQRQGRLPDDNIWKARLKETVQQFGSFVKEDLTLFQIPGLFSTYYKELLKNLFDKLESSGTLKYVIELAKRPKHGSSIANETNVKIEELFDKIFILSRNLVEVSQDLYYFIDHFYSKFGQNNLKQADKEIPYLLAVQFVKEPPFTYDFAEVLKSHILFLDDVFDYVKNKKLYVIYTTPLVKDKPSNWPLLLHEIAHILEEETIDIVGSLYSSRKRSQGEEARESNWALEICCDAIATISCGPIYGFRLLQNYLSPEMELSPDSPPVKRRIDIISGTLEELGWQRQSHEMKLKLQQITLPHFIEEALLPKHTKEIIARVKDALSKRDFLYQRAHEANIKKIAKRMASLKPCIRIKGNYVDLRDLLNAAQLVNEENLIRAQSNPREFEEYLGDSIRLLIVATRYSTEA